MIGTPGRVLDFLNKGTLKLTDVEHCILDEVDHMLDMGFAEDVEAILKFAYDRGILEKINYIYNNILV